VLRNTAGFVYYVAIAGITGTRSAADADITRAVTRLKRHTDLPVAVGFGIRNADQAAAVAKVADGAVVGSALVDRVAAHLDAAGKAKPDLPEALLGLVRELAAGVRGARNR
jgi:tryptophan synthase alpha chain